MATLHAGSMQNSGRVGNTIGRHAEMSPAEVGTSPAQLRALADWLVEREIDEVVMESTAQYWRPGRPRVPRLLSSRDQGSYGQRTSYRSSTRDFPLVFRSRRLDGAGMCELQEESVLPGGWELGMKIDDAELGSRLTMRHAAVEGRSDDRHELKVMAALAMVGLSKIPTSG
jgi:hypothetical protein